MVYPSAQLSCHDAPIFRLLLKIAVSLTASNVTFSIFARLRAATILQPQSKEQAMPKRRHVVTVIFRCVRIRRGHLTLPY